MDVDMDEDDTYIDNLLGLVELSEELGESGIDDESLSQETQSRFFLLILTVRYLLRKSVSFLVFNEKPPFLFLLYKNGMYFGSYCVFI